MAYRGSWGGRTQSRKWSYADGADHDEPRKYVTTMLDKYTKWAGTGYTYTGRTISATREVQVSKKMTTLLRH